MVYLLDFCYHITYALEKLKTCNTYSLLEELTLLFRVFVF